MDIQAYLQGKTVGVFFGGQSSEHDISIITGEFALAELKKQGINAKGIYIDKKGQFFIGKEIEQLKFFKQDYEKILPQLQKFSLDLSGAKDRLSFISQSLFSFSQTQVDIDFALPCFHGTGGEDGSIQGLFELFGVPYAGGGIWNMATTIDKASTKKLFQQEKIQTTDFLLFEDDAFEKNPEKIIEKITEKLTFPVFVKPNRAGSSIGISKVKEEKDLKNALELAFFYDNEVIVENGVDEVRDLTCAVISDGEKITPSEIQESIFADGFLNYEDKYLSDGGTQLGESSSIIAPAEITAEEKAKIQELSMQIFSAFKSNGISRVDFLMNKKTGEIFANEINPLPGTFYHHLWEKTGISFKEVLFTTIAHGKKRKESNKTQNAHFESNVLHEANSLKLQQKK